MKKSFIILCGILCITFWLRYTNIANNPSGFFCDEASIGYDAYSILHTGKDQHGIPFPLFFRALGDYRPPLAVYFAIPSIWIFGLNELSTRLPSAVYGVMIVICIYLIGKELYEKRMAQSGILAACIAATMPWLIHYNRTGFEFSIYALFFTITVYLFIKTQKNHAYIIPAFIAAACTFYTYQPAKLLIPLFIVGVLALYRTTYVSRKRETAIGLLIFALLGAPVLISFFNGQGLARFNMVSVFSANLTLTQSIMRILENYVTQILPSYFFVGEPTFITRHFVGGLKPLLIVTVPFFYIGIAHTLWKAKTAASNRLVLYWFLLYPLAGAVTADAPFTARAIIGAPLAAILITSGIIETLRWIKTQTIRRVALFMGILLFIGNFIQFTTFYTVTYPLYASDFWGWQYGPKAILTYFKLYEAHYDEFYLEGKFNAPEIFIPFYLPEQELKTRVSIGSTEAYNPMKRQLFAISRETYSALSNKTVWIIKEIIYYPNASPAFFLITHR